jgi:ribose transport system ATP-binding protein
VVPEATVAENIMMDKLDRFRKLWGIDWKAVKQEAEAYRDMVGLNIPLGSRAAGLSAAQKQLIQIAKALSREAQILMLDEPTSSITEHEARTLFRLLRQLKEKGVLVVIVSHKLEEIFAVCDIAHVLRDGEYVGSLDTATSTEQDVIELMIGRGCRDEDLGVLSFKPGVPALEVKNVRKEGMAKDVSLKVYPGEILGLYGLVGAGRTELAKLIIGETPMEGGEVYVHGRPAQIRSIREAQRKYRIGYITENRKEEGLFLDFSVRANVAVATWERLRNAFTRKIDIRAEKEATQSMIDRLSIRITSQQQPVVKLSGGNQQKVSISRWLLAEMDILIIDEPTVGIDIGAKEYIHELIWNLAEKEKKAIILISSDMPEIIKLARRIQIFRDQRVVGELDDLNEYGACDYSIVSKRIGAFLA